MRYGSLIASAAVLLGLAACKGNSSGMNDDLARDLDAAKSSDALSLAPHSGVQTVVSAEELSKQGRARMQASARVSREVQHRTPHRDRVAKPDAEVATVAANVPDPAPAPSEPAAQESESHSGIIYTTRPQPVDVSYPASGSGSSGSGQGGGGGMGAVIGAIGGAILRGGIGGVDHCDPRAHRRGVGGILINQRGPILRGSY
jgi:hypothetical protein